MKKQDLTTEEQKFLELVNDPNRRPALLTQLEQLGLLTSFLESEAHKHE